MWGELADYNEKYGITEDQLAIDEHYESWQNEQMEKQYKKNDNQQSGTISIDPNLFKE